MKTRAALAVGQRVVLAMTCWHCGELKVGSEFDRYDRMNGTGRAYIDRRCKPCRWKHMEGSPGRSRVV